MTIYVKYDFSITCEIIIREQLDLLGVDYLLHGIGEIQIRKTLTDDQHMNLVTALKKYGIEILDDQKLALVQRIKNAVDDMLADERSQLQKISAYLSEKLNYSYAHLSNHFSEATHSSIENYLILRKVDHVKDLISNSDLTLTEIAHRLNYSSVAHLSGQFKKTTGITPTTFQNILKKRRLQKELVRNTPT